MERREFLKKFTLLSTTLSAPTFLVRGLRAAQQSGALQSASSSSRVLIVVELAGGCDGLNTVIPHGNLSYYAARPTIAIPSADVLKLNEVIGLHPSLQGVSELYAEGKVGIIQGVGYPNPNRSHFRSRDIWHTAEPDVIETEGWLAKYFDAQQASVTLKGINIGGTVPRAMTSQKGSSPAITSIDTYRLQTDSKYPQDRTAKDATFQRIFSEPHNQLGYFQEYVTQTVLDATISSVQLLDGKKNYSSSVVYLNNAFATNLKTIAQIISTDLGVKVFYTTLGGFDTHAAQVLAGDPRQGVHANLLSTLSTALKVFYEDMKQMGKENEVLIVTFSEFGRRVNENGSAGTDHGTANQMFVLGGLVNGGIYSEHPSLDRDKLDAVGDMKFNVDFRAVYATLLGKWLGVDPGPIVGGSFPVLTFI
ncbi:MAG: DUF1501 domain-containing protein [Acidobacteria bacterium]|nr:DUF1501 domain-containing protein [Acidobacteriota bacterium]